MASGVREKEKTGVMRMKRARVGAITAGVVALLMSASYAPEAKADSTSAAQNQIRAELEKWTRDFDSGERVGGLLAVRAGFDFKFSGGARRHL